MNCLKVTKAILFLLALVATFQIISVFRTERLIRTVEELEPVVTERILQPIIIEPTQDPVTNTTYIVQDLISRPTPDEIIVEPRIDCILDDKTQQMILDKSEQYNVDFAFTMAVIFRESSFRSDVISSNGDDYGLMQINKFNHNWLSKELGITDFLDPEQNVTAGLHMLHDLFEKYEEPALVLMAYNMGEPSAKKLWNQGIYTSDYAEAVLQQAEIYEEEIQERMG